MAKRRRFWIKAGPWWVGPLPYRVLIVVLHLAGTRRVAVRVKETADGTHV